MFRKMLLTLCLLGFVIAGCSGTTGGGAGAPPAPANPFTLSSNDLPAGAEIGAEFANIQFCNGANKSPELSWANVPANGVESLAVTVTDPDANDFVHWIVFNIDPSTTSLARATPAPAGAAFGINQYGASEYGGPCPPNAGVTHSYVFKVWALDIADLTTDATIDFTNENSIITGIANHEVDSATITRDYTAP